MALSPGTRLGPYEIIGAIGAGGMGEVYRATDSRLDRRVAIKTLSPSLAADSRFRERFDREARAISQLAHPHICTLYDVGEHAGTPFLVMEYLEGETLADRLNQGALPLNEALRVAIEIADALTVAHRAGIVHRDLKPGNIMLTKTGAKLLDFGLAKIGSAAGVVGLSMLPTTPPNLTAPGTILGTLPYMAPEQLEGREADARTDIFALGTIIYEIVTGRRAFHGTSQASLIVSIMSSRPNAIAMLQPAAHAGLDSVVAGCLEKDPEDRWQSVQDVQRQLIWVANDASVVAPAPARAFRASALAWLAGIMVVALAFAIVGRAFGGRGDSAPPTVTRSVIPLPSGTTLTDDFGWMAWSRDGTMLAFAADAHGEEQLFMRRLSESEARPVPGTVGAYSPFFSPDGRWLGFVAGGNVMKVALGGGAPQMICGCAGGALGASWGDDNRIVLGDVARGLTRVSADGGTPQILTTPNRAAREKSHRHPDVLPGGRAVIMTVGTADITSFDDARIELVMVDSGERRVLIAGGTYARYVPTGHLVYVRGGSLLAVPFDITRLAVTGPPVVVVEDLLEDPLNSGGTFAVSRTGSLVYARGGIRINNRSMIWVDSNGRSEPAADVHRPILAMKLSPDGERVALQLDGATMEIWIHDFVHATTARLAYGWDQHGPLWTPNGRRVTFSSTRETHEQSTLFWQLADGTGAAEALTSSAAEQNPNSWSPDGKTLAFTQTVGRFGTRADVWLLALDGAREPKKLRETKYSTRAARFSPDGRWLSYLSNETGRSEVYVQAFPGPSRSWQVSLDGGTAVAWAPDGRQLFFRNGAAMMAVDVSTGTEFAARRPRQLFDGDEDLFVGSFDVGRDGRFLMTKRDPRPPVIELEFVHNWSEELKARMPTK